MTDLADAILEEVDRLAAGGDFADPQAERCRQLWCSVLLQEIRQIQRPRPLRGAAESAKYGPAVEWLRSRSWVRSKDFSTVCHLAGFDPESVFNAIRGYL